ncbi:MAG TPA: hypothetical protein VIZ20_06140 [Streptosporangiaceae bacterium]
MSGRGGVVTGGVGVVTGGVGVVTGGGGVVTGGGGVVTGTAMLAPVAELAGSVVQGMFASASAAPEPGTSLAAMDPVA